MATNSFAPSQALVYLGAHREASTLQVPAPKIIPPCSFFQPPLYAAAKSQGIAGSRRCAVGCRRLQVSDFARPGRAPQAMNERLMSGGDVQSMRRFEAPTPSWHRSSACELHRYCVSVSVSVFVHACACGCVLIDDSE